MVAGLENRIVFSSSAALTRDAKIIDALGNKIAAVAVYPGGQGLAIFQPQKAGDYFLSTAKGQTMALPRVSEEGLTLLANNIDDEVVHVRIEASPGFLGEKLFLKGYVKGTPYFKTAINFESQSHAEIEIPKAGMPNGILKVTVEDELDQLWAERPLYIEKNELHIHIEPISDEPSLENQTFFRVLVTDEAGKPLETTLSIGANDYRAQNEDNTDFLEAPLAKNNMRSRRFANDLRLLTGQKPIGVSQILDNELPSDIFYDFQNGLDFFGQAYDLNNNLLSNTKIQVLITAEENVTAKEVNTDDKGMFSLSDLQIDGEASMVFRTVAEESKERMVKVIPFEYEVPPIFDIDGQTRRRTNARAIPKRRKERSKKISNPDDLIALDGVTLVEKKIERSYTPSVYGIEPTRVTYQDPERPKTIPQLFQGIPGVQVSGLDDLFPRISLPRSAGAGPVLWVLDGLPLIQPMPLNDIISLVPYIDVDRIEILFGAQASIYGTRAAGGAILIYTRNGNFEEYYSRKKGQLTFQGFHQSLDFAEYLNELSTREKKMNKARYWNPSLRTDKNGEALLRFDHTDERGGLKIEAMAITPDGRLGKVSKVF